jgi:glycopeptide antibiotics resistance protein
LHTIAPPADVKAALQIELNGYAQMKLNFLALICIAVLCITLTLGLWPFHSPANDVSWLENHDGLRFGKHGTVIGSGVFQISSPGSNSETSLEIWLQPKRAWGGGTLLAFYKPGNLYQFSLHQSLTDLLIRTGAQHDQYHARTANLYAVKVFRRELRPLFITITSGVKGVWIYIDGVLTLAAPEFPLSAEDFTGRLVLGDSPGQTNSWPGELLGLALYHRKLTAPQVSHNYTTWKQTGRPEITEDERAFALYLFDEHTGNVVRDKARSGVDLYIPERFKVMEKITLEPFWTEFSMSWSYWKAALQNIVGFIPFGFCFYAYLVAVLPIKRATLLTVALGTAVSLTIEILQAFLPTRDSGTTDLITNTLGSWVGVASYKLLFPKLARSLPVRNFSQQLYIPLNQYPFKRSKT